MCYSLFPSLLSQVSDVQSKYTYLLIKGEVLHINLTGALKYCWRQPRVGSIVIHFDLCFHSVLGAIFVFIGTYNNKQIIRDKLFCTSMKNSIIAFSWDSVFLGNIAISSYFL